jgi:hypothetical protein
VLSSQTIGEMDDGVLGLLADTRRQLIKTLAELTDKRETIGAKREEVRKDFKEVGDKLEATRRVLGLVEAMEQQLAGQGQAGPMQSGPDHSSEGAVTEVRGGAWADTAVVSLS